MTSEAIRTERRGKGLKLPGFLDADQAGAHYIGYEGWRVDVDDGADAGAAVVAVTYTFSVDGRRGARELFESRLVYHGLTRARVLRMEGCRGGGDSDADGIHHTLFAAGLCIAAWLFMQHPRRSIRVVPRAAAERHGRTNIASLTPAQVQFWNDTLRGGLLEYLWINRIPFTPCVEMGAGVEGTAPPAAAPAGKRAAPLGGYAPTPAAAAAAPTPPATASPSVLVPLGGGKDSLTVLELLADAGVPTRDVTLFYLTDSAGKEWATNWRIRALWRASGVADLVRCEFDLPGQVGAKAWVPGENDGDDDDGPPDISWDDDADFAPTVDPPKPVPGIVASTPPWAAMVCFASAVPATLLSINHIAVGNERSANFGNGVAWLGAEVNHQYDKGFAWERAAHAYVRKHVNPDVHYFSALMHLWETEIAARFCANERAYLALFLSCNTPTGDRGAASPGHTSRWCCACAKCVFVFLLISAHAPPPAVIGVFGDNLFYYETLRPLFRQLLGVGTPAEKAMKPLDCVGTKEEARLSLLLARQQYARHALVEAPVMLGQLVSDVAREMGCTSSTSLEDEEARLRRVYLPQGHVAEEEEEDLRPAWFRAGGVSP